MKLEARVSRPRCPYCHGDLTQGGDQRSCTECSAQSHAECWTEHGGCPACASWRRAPSRRHGPVRVVARARLTPEQRRFRDLRRAYRLDRKTGVLFLLGLLVTSLVVALVGAVVGESTFPMILGAQPGIIVAPAGFVAVAFYLIKESGLRAQARREILEEQNRPTPDPDYLAAEQPTPDPDDESRVRPS